MATIQAEDVEGRGEPIAARLRFERSYFWAAKA
jgi:hypothetical protein